MKQRSLFRLFLALGLCLLVAETADAQRRGRGRGRGGGGNSSLFGGSGLFPGGSGGGAQGRGGRGSGIQLLPTAALPVDPDPFGDFPSPGRNPGTLRGGLLPPPEVAGIGELPEIPEFESDSSSFPWRNPNDPELERFYFEVCDHDANEWISFREARESLRITRDSFSVYDTDRDGRIQPGEFSIRFAQVVERTGSFAPPRPPVSKGNEVLQASDEENDLISVITAIQNRFDTNGDLSLSSGEIDVIITTLGLPVTEVTSDVILAAVDSDGSGSIEGQKELRVLAEALEWGLERYGISMKQMLSGRDEPEEPAITRAVRKITEPTPHFTRLDQDGDGKLSTEDLTVLQSPMHLSVRANAMLAALDTDGDGKLTVEEFRTAFGDE